MSTETLLRQAVKGALALGAGGAMVGGGAALAQTAAPASATATQLSKIIVTGTHIPRTSIATAQPIVTINRQQIEATGFTTTGQLLQNLTSSGTALNVNFNNGGTGASFITLHDLGSKRVLVLVNGQRWIPSLAGPVDLSTIPLAVVDHIEVLLDGASAVYGSDAIAGVINIITVKNFNGAEADAYVGMYDGHGDGGGWDGKTQQYSFTVGTSGDRSGVLLSAGYYNQNPIWAGQRTISKEPLIDGGQSSGSSSSAVGQYGIFAGSSPIPNLPGCGPTAYYGYPGCFLAGPITGPDANPHPYTVADNFNYAPLNYVVTPSERYYAYSQGHYDLTDNITFNFMTTYNQRNSQQILAPNPWVFGLFGYTANGLPIGISSTNPYNPFGVDLVPGYPGSSVADAWCSRYGTAEGGGCTDNSLALPFIAFRPLAAGNRVFNQQVRTFYFNGGFNGYWQMFGNQWTWNAHYIYGQTQQVNITTGLANTARLQTALGPLDACQASPGCVPLNMFGGNSQITPDMTKYVLFNAHGVVQQTLRDYNVGIGGNFFNGWYAGPWGVAAGYEYLETDGYSQPDALISAGNTVGNVVQPTQGRENTNAQYVELNVPLASNMFLAKELSVDVANRWSQFKWNGIGNVFNPTTGTIGTAPGGGDASTSTARVQLKWKPIDQLLLRASWSEGFRVPSISELFFGASDSFPAVSDPCAVPVNQLPAGCHGIQHFQSGGQIKSTVGGNIALQPEQSTSRTVGFVYSPSWAPGFDFSADYFKTEVLGVVGRNGAQFWVNQCYLQQNASACQHVLTPGAGNRIFRIIDLNSNSGSLKVEGYDSEIDYKFPTTPVGNFTARLNMNFITQQVGCNAGGQCGDVSGSAGGFTGFPKHRYTLGLDWSYGPWAANYTFYVIGPMWEDCDIVNKVFQPPNSGGIGGNWCSDPHKGWVNGHPGNPLWPQGQNHLGTTVYSDVQGSYTVSSWNTTFTVGINNLFDKSPPIARTAFGNSFLPVYYRPPGRFFYGRVSVNF